MTTIYDCLQRAVKAGELERSHAEQAQEEYERLVARYADAMPRAAAEAQAVRDIREATKAAATRRRHAVLAQLQTMQRMKAAIEASDDPGVILRNLIEYSEGSGHTGLSVVSTQSALIGQMNAMIRNGLRELGKTVAGSSRAPARLKNVIRELHGEATGDARAVELATEFRKAQDWGRRQFNAHGGDIGELENYGVRHSHDAAKLRRAGPDVWKSEVRERLDWSRITNHKTGKPFVAEPGTVARGADAEKFLDDVFEAITSAGWSKREAGMTMGGKALYNQRAEARQLHFKDGSAWLEYNERFGTRNPFDALVGGLHSIARDIALMKVLGPNPAMGLEFARQTAVKQAKANLVRAAGDAKALKRAEKAEARLGGLAKRAKAMLAHVDGSANVTEYHGWAAFSKGTRAYLTSVQLGSAVLSSVTDTVTVSMAAKVVGMHPTNVMSRHVQLIASNATRETAAQMGYIASSLAETGMRSSRYYADSFTPEVVDRVAGFTLRASGLNHWTDMAKIAFQMEFSGFLATNAGRSFDQIDAPLRQLFESRGISPADWDMLRDPKAMFRPEGESGPAFISAHYWREATDMDPDAAIELATRLQMLIDEQVEIAVPSASVEGRAAFIGENAPGTFAGEFLRSAAMYKSFAVSLMLRQVRRFQSLPTRQSRWQYAAQMSIGLLLMGGVAIQLKELAKGRDPRPMTDHVFWTAAMMQGGGLGIFGDFFASETNRVGGGLAQTLTGPVVGLYSNVLKPVASNASRISEGKDPLLGRDVANFVRYNTPVASSLWYARLGFDRYVADQLQNFLDPKASDLWHRAEQKAWREMGTRSWFARGDLRPHRAPDFANIVRDR